MAKRTSLVIAEGFDRLEQLLKNLPEELRRKALKDGLRDGAKVIEAEARRLVPVRTGALRNSIATKPATKLRNKSAVGYRVIAGDDDYKGDQFYAAFLEYGWWKQETYIVDGKIYSMKRGRGTPTWMPPKPFMRPALENARTSAANAVLSAVKTTVDAYLK